MPTTPFSTLARTLARGTRPGDLLPELHRELLAATGGRRSVVLEAVGAPGGDYLAASGRGFAALETLSVRGPAALALRSLAGGGLRIVDLRTVPMLNAQLAADEALLVPITLARRETILLVAGPVLPEPEAMAAGARAAVEFGIVIEWSRL